MSRRSAIEQIVIEEKTVCDAVLKVVKAREKGELGDVCYISHYYNCK